ncbi:haloalkane dehalogenase [Aestuariirhabdus litorea]|uniref:Alpha/beta fold hydrolase n=1 Tax=Aestuariirhabdus litorea TaxID=2528527 RepID=A0A3P3VTN1_9GAMM|nr:haloalkane dehalogenase [Aestuariirhabdus litorea]RRJ84113.1 alpha/beta fold hydrolase [Aestuariirhabdus litorea]RWW97333.1 alpha/beta fold hydrolase [Endozoicomonadaceae bacterium GTF-13]
MDLLRTPDSRFSDLPDYPFEPRYAELTDPEGNHLRMHYVDEGQGDETLLLLHGEPSWSYLYRHMIPPLVAAGYRVLAPDLIGFGRSDKPARRGDYSYPRHLQWLQCWLDLLQLQGITLFCQDWGGLLGLRLLASEPARFARVVTANTFLPTAEREASEAFLGWRRYSQEVHCFSAGEILQRGTQRSLSKAESEAYEAPFPNESYKQGARQFPMLVPVAADDPQALANREAWQSLMAFQRPWLTLFSDGDPITAGGDRVFQKLIPGCQGQPHQLMPGGHFLQEDCSEALSRAIIDFIRQNPVG